jgi:hypothetical protein
MATKPRDVALCSSREEAAVEPEPGLVGFGDFRTPAPMEVDFNLDLTAVADGWYLAMVTRMDLAIAKGSGQPYFRVAFSLDQPGAGIAETVLSFHPRSLQWTMRRLEAMRGSPLPRGPVNVADPAFRDQFIGRRVKVRVGHRVGYFGYPEAEVVAILPAEAVGEE